MQFFRHFGGNFFVNAFLHIFNQRNHVAHAQNAPCHAVGVKRLQTVDFLAYPQKLNRLACYLAHRQRRTAARIAIHFGQNHACERQGFVKRLRGVHRILPQHRIHHKQRFHRVHRRVNCFDFVHHFFVNRQTPCGIHHQHVIKMLFGVILRGKGDVHRLLRHIRREKIHAHLLGQQFQLLNRGGAIHVCRHQQDFLFLILLFEQARQFAHSGGFARALQARHQHGGRRRGG